MLISGYVLGGAPGFAVGAVAALASNMFFGQGPWTPWQMAGWGLVGIAGALLGRATGRQLGRVPLAIACGALSYVFGAWMNLSLWVTYSGDHTAGALWAYFATSLTFDIAHVAGNVLFCLAFGPALVRALARYRTRFEVRWLAVPAAASVLLLAAASAPGPAAHAADANAAAVNASVRYLLDAQNSDGGWGSTPGQASSQLYTGWTALGLAAAGRNPTGFGVISYMRAHASQLNDLGELNRTILILRAAGRPPRLAGRDLEKAVVSQQRKNGSFGGRVNTTAFAILGLRAAGRSTHDRADPPGRGVHRPQRQSRRRVQLRRSRRPVGDRRHRRGAAGARRRGPQARQDRQAGGHVHRPPPERRRRLRADPGRPVERAVDRLGGAGPARGRPRPRQAAPQRRARPDGLPALADRGERRGPLLADEPPDAGVGDRPGARRAVAQAAAAASRPARASRPAAAAAPAATATPAATPTPVKVQSLPPVATAAPEPPPALEAVAQVPAASALVTALMPH